MGYSRAKTRYSATKTIEGLIKNCPEGRCVYYWTMTMQRNVTEKSEAEAMLRPLKDLIRGEGGHIAGVWERQERGAWHIHFLTDIYLDVNFVRPFMVERGWGQQMVARRLQAHAHFDGQRWSLDLSNVKRLIRYIAKYVTKSLTDDQGERVRVFFCSSSIKASTVRFSWTKEENASTYLYYWGRALFATLYGREPKFHEIDHVMRLGVEDTDWLSVDPWVRWALGP